MPLVRHQGIQRPPGAPQPYEPHIPVLIKSALLTHSHPLLPWAPTATGCHRTCTAASASSCCLQAAAAAAARCCCVLCCCCPKLVPDLPGQCCLHESRHSQLQLLILCCQGLQLPAQLGHCCCRISTCRRCCCCCCAAAAGSITGSCYPAVHAPKKKGQLFYQWLQHVCCGGLGVPALCTRPVALSAASGSANSWLGSMVGDIPHSLAANFSHCYTHCVMCDNDQRASQGC